MRPFPLFFAGVLILLTASSCSKDKIDDRVVGHWRLVTDLNLAFVAIQPLTAVNDQMILKPLNIYEIRRGDKVTYAGVYHIDKTANPPQPTLHFSDKGYGFWISFSKDTLVLTYSGLTLEGGAIIRKYVKD